MNIKTLDNEFFIPEFGLGTWMIGGGVERDPENNGDADADSIRRALDKGITHIDTAELYADGYAEEITARAIADKNREDLFLVSKAWTTNLKFDDLITAAKQSLTRLQTDYLDLYLIHKPNEEIPLEETMRAMNTLKEEGLIKNIGVSNFSVETLKKAQDLSKSKIVANQVHYNLMFREPETSGLYEYCLDKKIMLIAWRPVEKGAIIDNCPDILREVSSKYNKTPAQVAINWLISQPGVVTLSTMRSEKNQIDNLGALGWELERSDIELLRESFPGQQQVSNAVPLS